MRIAVTYENGNIYQHFGHTSQFKLYDIENGCIVSQQIIGTNGSGHGALAGFLTANNVELLICGGIGAGAQNALANADITLYAGNSGDADMAVLAYLNGRLTMNSAATCGHHHGHGEGHNCGSHSC